ncbi:DUF1482 family protein [Escherichia coli]|uniref:DUF1482 family protein n=1 Tax=Escherichia coli TaxID=562 RepID=UPI000542D2EC|nr:DUF1482 family protein [Escherichia coli]EEZ8572391.1 DUF1482 family protein [Escherichia coli O113]EFB4078345.1 DUF1482 family protein [Escherichia coli O91]EAC1328706.1 DUF1482 family protein [Escherichia coli]EEV5605481.1 DUF1482 family protein [Escherichia coli]EEV7641696.1 DUF1482 family protein [Escherichia coli]
MNTVFALVMTVFLVSGEPVDIVTGIYNSMKECMAAAEEQKIPGNCYQVDKVIRQDNKEVTTSI